MIDRIRCGDAYTLDYLRTTGLINSPTLSEALTLVARCDIDAQDAGVRNTGGEDESIVFKIKSRFAERSMHTAEFETSQTGTVLLPAPGAGLQTIIEYASIRTQSTTGEAFLHANSNEYFKVYFTARTTFAAGQLFIPLGENEKLHITSTQGAKKLFVGVQYYTEAV